MTDYRTETIKIRFTPDELLLLKQHQSGGKFAAWLRNVLLSLFNEGDMPSRKDVAQADPTLLRQLAAIGNNLNQIARRLNSVQQLSGTDRIEILRTLRVVESAVGELRDR